MRIRKPVFSGFVASVALFIAGATLVAAPAQADPPLTSPLANGLTWADNGSTVTITGCTATCAGQDVVIPSSINGLPVTATRDGGDWDQHLVTEATPNYINSLTIPNSVTSFGGLGKATFGVNRIRTVTFEANSPITTLPRFPFKEMFDLSTITLPDHLLVLPGKAFLSDSLLTSITLPDTITTLGGSDGQLFQDTNITTVNLPTSLVTVGAYAFTSSRVVFGPLTLPAGVTTVEESAFQDTGITSLTLPSGLRTIGAYAFYGNDSLVSVTVPASVRTIGTNPFPVVTAVTYTAPSFSGLSPAAGQVGTPYSHTFGASGAAMAITDGSLPNGLSLDADSGVLSGTPTTPGTFTFKIRATNAAPSSPYDSSEVTLTIAGPPVVSSVLPTSGSTAGGTSVTVTGSNFVSGATVTIGGAACTSVAFLSASSLSCTTPAGSAGAADVVVTNPDTTSGTLSGGFTYAVPAPSVSSVSPTSGSTAGGTSVTVTGSNFVSGATVTIGGAACTSVTFSSANSLSCTTAAGTAGAADVVVTNPDTQTSTLTGGFTYTAGGGGGGGGGGNPDPAPVVTPSATPTPAPSTSASASPGVTPSGPPSDPAASAQSAASTPAGVQLLSAAEGASAQVVNVPLPAATSVAGAPVVTVPANTPVAPVVGGLPANTPLQVGMTASSKLRAKVTFAPIGKTRSNAKGRAKVPAFKASRPGAYTIRLATPTGKAYYVKVRVTAKSTA